MRALTSPTPKEQKQNQALIQTAKRVLKIESQSLATLMDRIDDTFAQVVHRLNQCEGQVIVTGMGKSGLIGGKIAATFSSIGLPAVFLHAADACHGD
ncbi:MAG: D-arabinose 5-phosphate isomerase, partial [Nitrospinaceae bacterium]|nr:D-arabinose 5-phosphate isomerase [Nitrospinaceae bacterium]NIR53964.1 D-arabinose 5-phosphate isomerase [Nitrospinaceae bacterium]NIS85406.1 D-arabinose 5-phosphate isomerase [Nitrospinaceae bacterium]NIT81184.1 D-arabinose 5-phosphate isomerase [Nitrospinaceae bacterium]NIU44476.1 D-arabinose 5-phosphate isomerase [Nitrospinaceae bacterium]